MSQHEGRRHARRMAAQTKLMRPDFQEQLEQIGLPGIILERALEDKDYCPYCMRCVALNRMTKRASFYWVCSICGAGHDERGNPGTTFQNEYQNEPPKLD